MTKFEIIEKIGQGGMGEVYKGRLYNENGFDKTVAAKKIIGLTTEALPREILKEAEVLSKLNHPNICEALDIREEGGALYILMEFIDGPTLSDVLELGIQKGYHFSEEFIWIIAKQILKGLEHAHGINDGKSSILHRDLSPHNVMINSQGTVKILDFGLARIENREVSRTQKSTYGKIRYCAPEIFNGEVHSVKSDLYALGLILYELCLGVKVFDGVSEAQIMSQIQNSTLNYDVLVTRGYSIGLKDFIWPLVAPKVADRFISASAALKALTERAMPSAGNAEGIVSLELQKLKTAGVEKTKTYVSPLKKKPNVSNRKWLLFSFSSLLLIGGVAARGLFSSSGRGQIQIKVVSEGKELELAPSIDAHEKQTVGGETGFYMAPTGCLYGATSILNFPSLLLDVEIETKLKSLNMNQSPDSFLALENQTFANLETFYELLKKNCGHNESFNVSAVMYEDLRVKTHLASRESFTSYMNLRHYLEPKVLFTEKKWGDLFKARSEIITPEKYARLEQQLKLLKIFDVKIIAGFSILNIDEAIFPKSVEECRLLLDTYWVKSIISNKTSKPSIQDFSVILTPFPLVAEISTYGKNFIEFKDNNKLENSIFKKNGICVYQRINGEVMESSLRRL